MSPSIHYEIWFLIGKRHEKPPLIIKSKIKSVHRMPCFSWYFTFINLYTLNFCLFFTSNVQTHEKGKHSYLASDCSWVCAPVRVNGGLGGKWVCKLALDLLGHRTTEWPRQVLNSWLQWAGHVLSRCWSKRISIYVLRQNLLFLATVVFQFSFLFSSHRSIYSKWIYHLPFKD